MRTSILEFQKLKRAGQKIAMITAYDAPGARLVEAAGVAAILVGDSMGTTVQGNDTTLPVTLDEIIYHTRMVMRGTSKVLVVADLPFMTYQINPEQALASAGRAMQEGGAGAVKLEGGMHMAETINRVVRVGIPVMGHIGLTPQSIYQLGGFKVQGRSADAAARLIEDAHAVEEAGAFAVVLEEVPAPLAKQISEKLHIPTIGIGAGPGCDGQIQVFHDVLGLLDFTPRHAKHYAELGESIRTAIGQYVSEVQGGSFPDAAHSFDLEKSS